MMESEKKRGAGRPKGRKDTPSVKRRNRHRRLRHFLLYGRDPDATSYLTKLNRKQLNIKRLIFLCGGVPKIMEACNLKFWSSVSRWVHREQIPKKHWKALCELSGGRIDIGDISKIVYS